MALEIDEYTIQDFGNLQYPVFDNPEEMSVMDFLGDALDYPEFHVLLGPFNFQPGDKDRVVRWVACCYDINSPFVKDYPDMNLRKTAAALYVGFEVSNRRFADHVEDIIMGKNERVVDMVLRYCRNYNSPDYSFLVAITDDFYRILREIQSGTGDYSFDQVRKMREEIKKLSHDFVVGDTSEDLKKKLYKEIDQDSLLLRPEDIAQKIEDGVQPVSDQEISNYKSEYIIEVPPTGDGTDS